MESNVPDNIDWKARFYELLDLSSKKISDLDKVEDPEIICLLGELGVGDDITRTEALKILCKEIRLLQVSEHHASEKMKSMFEFIEKN